MRDFYAPSMPAPLDQADGLRRLFAGRRQRFIALAANPHVDEAGLLLDRVAATMAVRGQRVLVVDAGDRSPVPHEMALLDLGSCIETLSPQVGYLAARGLPLAHVDTRGSAAGFLDALSQAAPKADVVLVHANATDLARLFVRRAARPILMAGDDSESVTHAYAACKLLAQRCGLMTFDLLLAANPRSRRTSSIASSLAGCADGFLGAVLHDWTVVDPEGLPRAAADAGLDRLLAAQLCVSDDGGPGARAAPAQPELHAN